MGVKVCLVDGCWTPTSRTRCELHEAEWQRRRNADPARKPRRTRAYMDTVIVGPCACCGTMEDLTRHHVKPLASPSGCICPPGSPLHFGECITPPLVPMCRRCNSSIGTNVMEGTSCPMHGGVVRGG